MDRDAGDQDEISPAVKMIFESGGFRLADADCQITEPTHRGSTVLSGLMYAHEASELRVLAAVTETALQVQLGSLALSVGALCTRIRAVAAIGQPHVLGPAHGTYSRDALPLGGQGSGVLSGVHAWRVALRAWVRKNAAHSYGHVESYALG
jgi:hypothetical protein